MGLVLWAAVGLVCRLGLAGAALVPDDGLTRSAEAYWIIDPTDQTCLTELGTFGACDDDALFMYLSRPVTWFARTFLGAKSRRSLAMVLEPVQTRSCLSTRKAGGRTVLGSGDCAKVAQAQQWDMRQSNARRLTASSNSDAVASIALTTNAQKYCVVRDSSRWSRTARMARALSGKDDARERVPVGALSNTVSLLACDSGGHTPLELTASNVANSGFLFQSADGAMCYDGARFTACSDEDKTQRWGVGMRWHKGRPLTSLYKFYNASACLVETKGDGVTLSHCDQAGAKGWGVTKGRLCRNGDCLRSGKCLARSAFDASAVLFPCSSNIYEHLTLTLDSDGSDTLAQALKEAAERERQEELDEQLRQKQLGARRSFAR